MHVIGIVFALLGIGLHLRMLGWVVDTEMRQTMLAQFSSAPLENQFLFVGCAIIPFAYYASCIYGCCAKHRSIHATIMICSIALAAAPYFRDLHATLPGVAKNALWAGFFSFIPFFGKSPNTDASLENDVENGQQ